MSEVNEENEENAYLTRFYMFHQMSTFSCGLLVVIGNLYALLTHGYVWSSADEVRLSFSIIIQFFFLM